VAAAPVDLFRRLLEGALQELIDTELAATIGAERHERTETRTNQRNGGRDRLLSTPAGDVELRNPQACAADRSSRASWNHAGRVDKALWAVIIGRLPSPAPRRGRWTSW